MQVLVLIVACFPLDDCSLAFEKNIIWHWSASMLTYNTQCRQICVGILLSFLEICCAEVLQKPYNSEKHNQDVLFMIGTGKY